MTATITGVAPSNTSSAATLLGSDGLWLASKSLYDHFGEVTETIDDANATSGQEISSMTFDNFGEMVASTIRTAKRRPTCTTRTGT